MTALPQSAEAPEDGQAIAAVAKRQTRAAEYRAYAKQAQALADASPLAHVREKHELAAARWEDLAVKDETSHAERQARAPGASSPPAANT
jgi:hypothetical protein